MHSVEAMIGAIVEDRYFIEEQLGTGAMGRVFSARHLKVGRRVAIKIMHEEHARNPRLVERFMREATVAARLRHTNLVGVLDVGTAPDGRPLIVLELAPGTPLSELEIPMPASRTIRLIRQLLEGLEHAHAAGLIHRDLKPDNVLVDENDVPRIVDFGIAVLAEDVASGRRLTEANTVIGTPFYMSPEQAFAKPVDHRTDLFSLGVIFYELLAGMPPFPCANVEVALTNTLREPPSIYERAGIEVDPLLESFARRLMARHLTDRFQSAREALDVLALIERDRIAAARALAARPETDVLPLVGKALTIVENVAEVEPADNTDTLTTIVDAVVAPDEDERVFAAKSDDIVFDSHPGDTVTASKDDDIVFDSKGDDIDELPVRTWKRFGVAIAASAMVMLAALGFAARGEQAAVPHSSIDTSEAVAMNERLSTSEAIVAEKPFVPVKREKADPRIVELLAMTSASAKTTKTMTTTKSSVAIASVANALPVDVKPAVVELKSAVVEVKPVVVRDSADSVVAKYVAVGKALKGARNDEAWARFRLIRINEAIATAAGRHDTLVALAAIEKQIAK